MSIVRTGVLAISTIVFAGLASPEAYAAPGGGSPRIEMPRPPAAKKKDQERETDFQKAEYLIKAEKFEEAIPLLQNVVADNPRDADAWNYLGFASRKLGRHQEALGYYQKALGINPGHRGAHEYLGELHLQMNNLPKAEEERAALKALCPGGCQELEDLEADIADYKAAHPAG